MAIVKEKRTMRNTYYKPIKRYSLFHKEKRTFIATGTWADGHIAYSEVITDENGEPIVDEWGDCSIDLEEEGCYIQYKIGKHLVIEHI